MPGWDIFFQTILSLFVENTSPTVFFCLDFCRVVFLDVSGDSQIPTSFFDRGHAQSLSECLAEALQRNLEACPRALLQGALQEGGTSARLGVTS